MSSESNIQTGSGGGSFGGFEHDFEYRSSATDIFSPTIIDSSCRGTYQGLYRATSVPGVDGPYFYDIPPEGNRCIIPSSLRQYVELKVQKLNKDTSQWVNTEATDVFGVTNNTCSALWNHIEVGINGKKLTTVSNPCQAYTSYFQKLLTYSKEIEDTVLACSLWRKHKKDFEWGDRTTPVVDLEASGKPWKLSTVNKLNDAIHTELATLGKVLPSGLTLQLTFTRNSSDFLILQKKDDTNTYRFHIIDMYLTVQWANLDASIHAEWNKMWAQNKLATFPITRMVMKCRQFASGLSYLSYPHIFQGMLPSMILIGLVNSQAYSSHRHYNPYRFHHYNMTDAVLYLNSKPMPTPKLKFDFENKQVKNALRVFYVLEYP